MIAETLAKALGGRKVGMGWMARCPAHDDREPSLSIRGAEGNKVLVCCHAGCDQHRVIAALRARGLWLENSPRAISRNTRCAPVERKPDQDGVRRRAAALGIWRSAQPAKETLVKTYLASRHIHIPPPEALRFHVGLKHPSGSIWPVMVALVTRGSDGSPLAVHRTFLARDGGGKASVEPVKMMLGPCRGGVIRLGPAGARLMIAEGIETALSAMQATGRPAWAAMSTSGLRSLELPAEVADVVVLADGDEPGETAAQEAGLRWKREGRRIRIARPPRGFDFNDALRSRATPSAAWRARHDCSC